MTAAAVLFFAPRAGAEPCPGGYCSATVLRQSTNDVQTVSGNLTVRGISGLDLSSNRVVTLFNWVPVKVVATSKSASALATSRRHKLSSAPARLLLVAVFFRDEHDHGVRPGNGRQEGHGRH